MQFAHDVEHDGEGIGGANIADQEFPPVSVIVKWRGLYSILAHKFLLYAREPQPKDITPQSS
jgi:hypothetical protein